MLPPGTTAMAEQGNPSRDSPAAHRVKPLNTLGTDVALAMTEASVHRNCNGTFPGRTLGTGAPGMAHHHPFHFKWGKK
eukprot:6615748-Heterocapsa_arctica.AAC.1